MSHLRHIRLLGALFAAALTLTLSAASPMRTSAAGPSKPSTPAAVQGGAGARSLPSGATACRSTQAKPSSSFAACGTPAAAAARSTATVSLPGGAAPCTSTPTKRSSSAAACTTTRTPAAAAAPATFTVTLTAGTPDLVPGGTTVLTASSNQDVGPTPYFIEIFDFTTGAFLVECGFGATCSSSVTQSGSTVQDYVAYISGFGTTFPPPAVQASSGVLVVSWLTVTLTGGPTVAAPGQPVLLTATASLDVGPTPFYIEIFDVRSGAFVTECGSGTSCSTFVVRASDVGQFVAYISDFDVLTFPPPGIRSLSGSVLVSWASVGLSASPTSLPAGGTANVFALASLDVGPTPWWIEIYDDTSGTRVAFCGFGTSCSASVSQQAATTHSYTAFIAAVSGTPPPPDVRSTSNTVAVTWTPVQFVTVPDLIGEPQQTAINDINAAGLVVGSETTRVDCNNLGDVDDQSPAAGAQVVAGSAVSITTGVRPAQPMVCP
jgi:hypothetical protein